MSLKNWENININNFKENFGEDHAVIDENTPLRSKG